MNSLILHLRGLKKEQIKPNASKMKEIIKIRAEIQGNKMIEKNQ